MVRVSLGRNGCVVNSAGVDCASLDNGAVVRLGPVVECSRHQEFSLRGTPMPCDAQILQHVPLFALLDEEELAVLAGQVELRKFAPRQRIYKMGEAGGR